ncbi:MAG: hypothetical protein ACI8QC_000156 [Planctomycetota bacterium]
MQRSPTQISLLVLWASLGCLLLGGAPSTVGAHKRNDPELVSVHAEQEKGREREYQLKAAFLYNFAKYTVWPSSAFPKKDTPIRFTVVGKGPFGKSLEAAFDKKKISGRQILVERVLKPGDFKSAHVLFLGEMDEKELALLLKRIAKDPVLVVADKAGIAGHGSSVGFYLEKGKVRFEVSPKAIEAAKLKLSSQLLKLARLVK